MYGASCKVHSQLADDRVRDVVAEHVDGAQVVDHADEEEEVLLTAQLRGDQVRHHHAHGALKEGSNRGGDRARSTTVLGGQIAHHNLHDAVEDTTGGTTGDDGSRAVESGLDLVH